MSTRQTLALCVPAYNASKYLPSLFSSIAQQAIPFDEILIYNDCSTDDTEEVAKRLGAKVITGDMNRGCSFGKNQLAKVSACNWIHFHDADDLLLPNFTEVAHSWIQRSDAPDIILLNYEYRDFNSQQLLHMPNYNREELLADTVKFVIQNKIVNFAICRTSSFINIQGFDLDQKVLYNEDRAFYSRAAIKGLKFDYEPTVTCINYRYSESMSASNAVKCIWAYFHVSEKLAEAFGDKYPAEIATGLWNNATSAAFYNDWDLVRANLDLAIRLNGRIPPEANPLVKLLCAFSPLGAYRLRENLIRRFKPHLR